MTFTTRGAPEVVTGAAALDRARRGEPRRHGRSERPLDELVGRVRHDRPLRHADRARARPAPASARSASRCGSAASTAGVTYHFRLVAANDIGTTAGGDRSFRTDSAPAVSTGWADAISDLVGARAAVASTRAGRGTVAWFEYGTTTALGNQDGRDQRGVRDTARRPSGRPIGGLQPGTAYHYRDRARSDAGTTYGQTGASGRAQGRSSTPAPATLSGRRPSPSPAPSTRSVAATNWWFELGPTTAYGTRTLSRRAGSGRGAVAVSETVTGLAPGTEYHAAARRAELGAGRRTARRRVPDGGASGRRPRRARRGSRSRAR